MRVWVVQLLFNGVPETGGGVAAGVSEGWGEEDVKGTKKGPCGRAPVRGREAEKTVSHFYYFTLQVKVYFPLPTVSGSRPGREISAVVPTGTVTWTTAVSSIISQSTAARP